MDEASPNLREIDADQHSIRFARNPCARTARAARKVDEPITSVQPERITQPCKLRQAREVQVLEARRDLAIDSVRCPHLVERRT